MPLTGPQLGRIHKAILAAFTRDELARITLTCMEIDFDHVVTRADFSTQVFDLVRWADRQQRVLDLVQCVREDRPNDPKLAALASDAHAWGAAATEDPPAAPPVFAEPHQIFLSYSHRDGALKARLLADLAAAGLTVWTDDGLEPGTAEWQRAIEQAIRDCRCLVAILSPDAKQSAWVNIEIGFASRLGRRIFPALARGDDLDAVPIALFNTQYVDLRADYAGQMSGKLLPALRRHVGAPPVAGASPATALSSAAALPGAAPAQEPPPIAFDWVAIPAGDFLMGSDRARDKKAFDNELPQHRVHLPAYRMARVPVTEEQYARFVQASGHPAPQYWKYTEVRVGKERHPARVSWADARAFCAWASEVTGAPVRLPSEAEWEKAARGTDGRIWPWGDEPPTGDRCNFNSTGTTPADAYPRGASPYGVLDMAGNVFEWTASIYRPYPYAADDGREYAASTTARTVRGGASYLSANFVRCAYRRRYDPFIAHNFAGFRIVSPGA